MQGPYSFIYAEEQKEKRTIVFGVGGEGKNISFVSVAVKNRKVRTLFFPLFFFFFLISYFPALDTV